MTRTFDRDLFFLLTSRKWLIFLQKMILFYSYVNVYQKVISLSIAHTASSFPLTKSPPHPFYEDFPPEKPSIGLPPWKLSNQSIETAAAFHQPPYTFQRRPKKVIKSRPAVAQRSDDVWHSPCGGWPSPASGRYCAETRTPGTSGTSWDIPGDEDFPGDWLGLHEIDEVSEIGDEDHPRVLCIGCLLIISWD